ncbi:Hypothetical protein, putative [Bodo saltans]|uniref:PLA2c domain-containing protein n=1 Tax=Bodo saltans TaxID=75058 RepID=A0A0S4J7Z7_BODSA|nr:Hypothetical protein, putative [Bodo saltans]|eukprot:CUG86623.1 Hypothetical protein, putative [Bodo saltans]
MGCGASKDFNTYRRTAGPNPPPLSPEEIAAISKRRPNARNALLRYLGELNKALAEEIHKGVDGTMSAAGYSFENAAPDALPRIGLAVSGGGWRAMTAAIALTDELSRAGLLDTIEVVAGLSGGSWFVQNWALGGTHKNVFHASQQQPWAYGGRFDPTVHRYEGLIHMLSEKVVHRSAQVPRQLEMFGKFAEFVTGSDLTFFRVLLLSSGGKSMISRYAAFLDQQLLLWQTVEERKQNLFLQNDASAKAVLDGTFPVLAVASIDTVSSDQQTPNAQVGKSKNVWAEFSTLGTRNRNIEYGKTQPITRVQVVMDDKKAPLTAGKLMGVCGSAFAFDAQQLLNALPSGLARVAKLLGVDDDESDVVIKKTLTETHIGLPKQSATGTVAPKGHSAPELDDVLFGHLRDAGLDFNIPFPLVLKQSSGRSLDIVIALDAGFQAKGATELATAVDNGYIEIENETVASLKQDFEGGERVRIFSPPKDPTTGFYKGPIIIYVVALNCTKSWKITYTRDEVNACTSLVRNIVHASLIPKLTRCIQNYAVDQLKNAKKITPERHAEWDAALNGEASPLGGSGVVLEGDSGEADGFRALTQAALTRLLKEPLKTFHFNPLDVVHSVEHELLSLIPKELHAAAIQRIAELVARADEKQVITFSLSSNPMSEVDKALLGSKWVRLSHGGKEGEGPYELVDETLFDYALAVNSIFELISFVEKDSHCPSAASVNAALSSVLNREANHIQPLPEKAPRVLSRITITDPSWRFVYSYASMLASAPNAGNLELQKKLVAQLTNEATKFLHSQERAAGTLGGGTLDVIAALTDSEYVRFDVRDKVRKQLGLSVVIESFCFLTVGDASCVANENLQSLWGRYIGADDHGRFAYIVLEAVLFCARGVRCSKLISALLPKAKIFIDSHAHDSSKKSLLSLALFCSSFQNDGNRDLLQKGGITGNDANPAQHCTLLDACSVGNHNAVEMILDELVTGPPPIEAVKVSIEKKFPKCIEALITDDEVTLEFLQQAQQLLQSAAEGGAFEAKLSHLNAAIAQR